MNTIGEKRVRTTFNPSQNDLVSQIKQKTAELINLCESISPSEAVDDDASVESVERFFEIQRWIDHAQTHYEQAAMYAVKAATA